MTRLLAWCLVLIPAVVHAQPPGIAPYPRSRVVSNEDDAQVLPREFVVAAVETVRRDLKTQTLKVNAARQASTYEMPPGTDLVDVIDHYERVLTGEVLFTCRSLDCGRSNGWANQIFGEAVLYGPDQNQYYRATELDGALIGVYVVQRGNRRVYAHVEVLEPERAVTALSNTGLTRDLAGEGFAIVQGVHPRQDGTLPEAGRAVLADLKAALAIFPRQEVYVVCHLYSPQPTGAVLANSLACAEECVRALASDGGPRLVPFGAGPLLPRPGNNAARVELVLPQRHNSD